MIERYTRPVLAALWSDARRFETWLRVELAVLEAMAREGLISPHDVEAVKAKARVDVGRIRELEQTLKHELDAFLLAVSETVGPEGRHLHFGLTSSDVMDTALAVLMQEATVILCEDLDALLAVLQDLAWSHRDSVMVGRTHGVHGEPITFGLKAALWYAEMARHRQRLERAGQEVSVGKVSGAMGTFAHLSPRVEADVCRQLGLAPETISNQIVQRDRHASYLATLAILAGGVERIATELRHLQRTEVAEVEEHFTPGQHGSSSMPHKRNPVGSENLCGLARLVRGYAGAALENMALWHERDISHSSVERVSIPDGTSLADFMVTRLTDILRGLQVYPDRMREHLERTGGLIYSETLLLALIQKGVARPVAYEWVQREAMRAWKGTDTFRDCVKADPDIQRHLEPAEIDRCFDLTPHLAHLDHLYARVPFRTGRER